MIAERFSLSFYICHINSLQTDYSLMIDVIKIRLILLLTLLGSALVIPAQQRAITIEWEDDTVLSKTKESTSNRLWFKGALSSDNEPLMPIFWTSVPVGSGVDEVMVEVRNPRFEVIDAENWMIDGLLPTALEATWELVTIRKAKIARVSVNPFVRRSDGRVERLTEGSIHVQVLNSSSRQNQVDFASQSKLSSGTWFRMGIPKDGVYELGRSFFEDLGVDVENIDPSTINIYGNDAGMLPFTNSEYIYDDLKQKAILFEGEADGSFDTSDHIYFYAKGPDSWSYDANAEEFKHENHIFSELAYCFIGIGVDSPKRIGEFNAPDGTPTHSVSSFDDHRFHEEDLENIIKSGRRMVGEKFGLDQALSFGGAVFNYENIDTSSPVKIRLRGVSATNGSSNLSQIEFTSQGHSETMNLQGVTGYQVTRSSERLLTFNPSGGNLGVSTEFSLGSTDAQGWVDFISVNVRRQLQRTSAQFGFRDAQSYGVGNLAEFTIGNMNSSQLIWDVTHGQDIVNVTFELSGDEAMFKAEADEIRQYVLFNTENTFSPQGTISVSNQNLHGSEQFDMVILSATPFLSTAEKVADIHREEGLSVVVLEPQAIYNEFSCGMQDITAIRMYLKMLYDRAGSTIDAMPDYFLLIGDGTYDHTEIGPSGSIYLPSYQSLESNTLTGSYVSDDFFGRLDDDETDTSGGLDIGIGRFPVRTVEEAEAIYNKIIRYKADNTGVVGGVCSESTETSFGDWKNKVLLVGDDEDGNAHMQQANSLGEFLLDTDEDYILNKVFLDAYQQDITPGGARYPQASDEIRRAIENGVFLVSYTGHGGEVGWAAERIFDVPTIQGFTNGNALPILLTATCEFSRFDDPGRTSAGEFTLLNPNGGVIALLTTTRLVYSGDNFALASSFFDIVMRKDATTYSCSGIDFEFSNGLRLGDVMRVTKNCTGGSATNKANFTLLGDPALRLSYPEHIVITDSIQDVNGNPITTMKALQKVHVFGKVVSAASPNVPLESFSGEVSPSLYDKAVNVQTLSNDGGSQFNFSSRKNVLYKGRATVTQGIFEYEFILPKDISYQEGNGKVFYYGRSDDTDAQGSFAEFQIGGTDSTAAVDELGPTVELFLDSEAFVDGGLTNESPVLIAKIFDENGVNTAGNGIGHDITAIIDDNTADPIVLNDYFSLNLDSYQSGELRFELSDLEEGDHTLRFKVWDIYNNSSAVEIRFSVRAEAELSLENVINYPNPFTTHTEFLFEHNQQACSAMEVSVQIFTVSGKLVKTIHNTVDAHRTLRQQVTWDGKDDYGEKLGRGVYVYKLRVTTPEGSKKEVFEKLVLL